MRSNINFTRDGDGVLNEFDNCVDLPNGDQADADADNKGKVNVCYISVAALLYYFAYYYT